MSLSLRALSLCALAACGAFGAAPPGLDALGDPLPDGALLRLGTARLRQADRIESLALSPDGRAVVTADSESRIHLWDTKTGRLLLSLSGKTGGSVAFSPDGRSFATAGGARHGDQPGRLWDARTGQLLLSLPALTGRALAFSPDGSRIAGCDGRGIVVCEIATGRVDRRLPGPPGVGAALAFSPDGKALAVGDTVGGGKIAFLILDVATGKERCRMTDEGGGWTRGLAFSPDGKTLAAGTPYKAHVWDARTGAPLADLGHGPCNAVAFDRAGRLITAGDDIAVREPVKWKVVRSMHQGRNFAEKLAASTDGSVVATNAVYGNRVRLWDTATGEQRLIGPGHLDDVRAVAWSPDGKMVATGCGGDGTLRLWETATGSARRVLLLGGELDHFSKSRDLSDMAFSPDGRTLRGAGRRWDPATGSSAIIPSGGRVTARTRDGRLLALADDRGRRGTISIQDETGRVLHRFHPLPEGVDDGGFDLRCLTLSPDGRLLAVAQTGRDRSARDDIPAALPSVHLYDTRTGTLVRRMRPARREPESMAFSPDGALLATSMWRGKPELFDVATGRRLFEFAGHDDGARHWDGTRPLAFSPDGALLATGGEAGALVLWETASGREVRTLRGHVGWVRSLAFSPDGTRLLSGGADSTALIWAVAAVPAGGSADELWAALAGEPSAAYAAMAALRARDLKGRLRPDPALEVSRVAGLIADLEAEEFEARERAERDLRALGVRAEAALRRAAEAEPDLERRKRVRRLLALLERPITSDELRQRRAIQALEGMKTPEAVALLKMLAAGGTGGRQTLAARAALERLRPRSR